MMTLRSPHRRHLAIGALGVTLVFAGCGSEPGTTHEEMPTAADGTDHAACDDGACEVAVSGPVEFGFGEGTDGFTFTITAVTDNGIEYEKTGEDGNSTNGGFAGSCTAVITATSGGTSCYPAGAEPPAPPEPEEGVLVLQLLGVADGTAIVRFAMG